LRTTLPLYQKLADLLYERIRAGTYPLGADLPTEAQLVAELKASTHTVRHALRLLTERGLVVRRAGSGSRVIAVQEHTVFSHSVGNLQQLLRYPDSTYREVLESEHITADAALGRLLRCDVGTPWFRIRCLRWAEGGATPLCWTDIFLLPRHAGILRLPTHGTTPVYDQIELTYGERVERAQVDIEASQVTARQAAALKVAEGTAAIVVTRRYSNAQDDVFEITVSTHPEGRFVYSLDFKRELKRR
jgi:GntR family transcriptional regulator